jgi:hypothetical protein
MLRKFILWALGDCDNCGHSVMYHLPIAGCTKCDCEEYE